MPTATNAKPSLPFRNDTILGVCEAIGQDFGFHANWLRVTLAGLFYFAPVAVVATYLLAGVVVAATRWFVPDQHSAAPQAAPLAEPEPLPIAA